MFSEEHPVLTGSRELDGDAAVALLQGLFSRGQDSVRLHRAMVHYNEALLHWRPASALKSVEWLFVAVENMAPVALADHKAHSRKTDAELAREWAVAPRKCPECGHTWTPHGTIASAARATLVLDGDRELFKQAKDISEGLEHGYADMPSMHRDASECRDPLAAAVRTALIRLLAVDGEVVDVLTAPPYDKPQRRDPVNRGVAMKLRGPVSSLAPDGERHPLINVTQEIKKAVLKPDGSGDLTITDNLDYKSGGATAEHIERFASDRASATEITSVVIKSGDGTIKYDSSKESPDSGLTRTGVVGVVDRPNSRLPRVTLVNRTEPDGPNEAGFGVPIRTDFSDWQVRRRTEADEQVELIRLDLRVT